MTQECEHDWYEYADSYTGSGTHCWSCRKCPVSVYEEPESHKVWRRQQEKEYHARQEARRLAEAEVERDIRFKNAIFESWALGEGGYSKYDLRIYDGKYSNKYVLHALAAWNAAAKFYIKEASNES
jgi:hypothetical protein